MDDRYADGQKDPGSGQGVPAFDSGIRLRTHILTVVVEDYFHVAPLKSVVRADRWYRFERRVESNTRKALDLLDEYEISATFFVLGSIADEMPELVREIADRGHEVASKGYFHHSISHFSREEFRDDVARSLSEKERPVRVYRRAILDQRPGRTPGASNAQGGCWKVSKRSE
ncbi:polysaccharide deacetylase family protein [Acidobacteriota bacterium]